jgi:hypothetical protein
LANDLPPRLPDEIKAMTTVADRVDCDVVVVSARQMKNASCSASPNAII